MRYRVFKDRVNCDVQANESLEIDQYGALHHTHLLLHSGDGAITGCVRFPPTTSPTMFGDTFPLLLGDADMPSSRDV